MGRGLLRSGRGGEGEGERSTERERRVGVDREEGQRESGKREVKR